MNNFAKRKTVIILSMLPKSERAKTGTFSGYGKFPKLGSKFRSDDTNAGGLPGPPFVCVRHKSKIILVVASELQFHPVLIVVFFLNLAMLQLAKPCISWDTKDIQNGSLPCLLAKTLEHHHLEAGLEPGRGSWY